MNLTWKMSEAICFGFIFRTLCVCVFLPSVTWIEIREVSGMHKNLVPLFIYQKKQQTPAYYRSNAALEKGRKDILCLLLFRNRGSVFWYLRQQVEEEASISFFKHPVGPWLFKILVYGFYHQTYKKENLAILTQV